MSDLRFTVDRLDVEGSQYAISCCNGVDSLAITHLDKMDCEQANRLNVPIRYLSFGPTWKDKEERQISS